MRILLRVMTKQYEVGSSSTYSRRASEFERLSCSCRLVITSCSRAFRMLISGLIDLNCSARKSGPGAFQYLCLSALRSVEGATGRDSFQWPETRARSCLRTSADLSSLGREPVRLR